MYLEGVIVCVGYSDFLAASISNNKSHFDNLVVVTSLEDEKTRKLCEHHHVKCVQTDVFYENGASFAKAKGINVGLEHLSKKGWVIHLDADIYLPPLTRSILEKIELNPEYIYGIDRMMCPSYQAWQNYISDPKPIHEGWIYVHPNIFPIGVRIAEYTNKGYEPIGFFQLWNPSGSGVYAYPAEHGKADRTDVLFCKQWSRGKRQFIPEIISIHLDSEGLTLNEQGKNWGGRKTRPFTFDETVQCLNVDVPKEEPKRKRIFWRCLWKRCLLWLEAFLSWLHRLFYSY